jgi:hypothetical protein
MWALGQACFIELHLRELFNALSSSYFHLVRHTSCTMLHLPASLLPFILLTTARLSHQFPPTITVRRYRSPGFRPILFGYVGVRHDAFHLEPERSKRVAWRLALPSSLVHFRHQLRLQHNLLNAYVWSSGKVPDESLLHCSDFHPYVTKTHAQIQIHHCELRVVHLFNPLLSAASHNSVQKHTIRIHLLLADFATTVPEKETGDDRRPNDLAQNLWCHVETWKLLTKFAPNAPGRGQALLRVRLVTAIPGDIGSQQAHYHGVSLHCWSRPRRHSLGFTRVNVLPPLCKFLDYDAFKQFSIELSTHARGVVSEQEKQQFQPLLRSRPVGLAFLLGIVEVSYCSSCLSLR